MTVKQAILSIGLSHAELVLRNSQIPKGAKILVAVEKDCGCPFWDRCEECQDDTAIDEAEYKYEDR